MTYLYIIPEHFWPEDCCLIISLACQSCFCLFILYRDVQNLYYVFIFVDVDKLWQLFCYNVGPITF